MNANKATTASITALNSGLNGGDLGDILEDSFKATVSEDNLKQTAISMAIGGLAGMMGEWIGNYTGSKPNLDSGSYDDSSVGMDLPKDGTIFERPGLNMLSPYENNPMLKTSNTIPGFPSATNFHDIGMGNINANMSFAPNFLVGSTMPFVKATTIAPYFALNYCVINPALCSLFIDEFIYAGTYGKVDVNVNSPTDIENY